MLHDILRYLKSKGHECRVISDYTKVDEYEGIKIFKEKGQDHDWYLESDCIITHLGKTGRAWNLSQSTNKPLFHVIHNSYNNSICRVKPDQYIIYNSCWVRDAHKWNQSNIVCRPIIDVNKYFTKKTGEHITLINLNKNKGGEILKKIAIQMPDHKFLGVKGSANYGTQITDQPDNVEIVEHTSNMKRDVYSRTRLLIMPSEYESWGRTAIEAMISGIPVIANPTPGLIESIGPNGIFVSRHDIDKWAHAIKYILNEKNYLTLSNIFKERAEMVCSYKDFEKLEQFLITKIKDHESKSNQKFRRFKNALQG